jgi:predicted nicotinamide N-methyase
MLEQPVEIDDAPSPWKEALTRIEDAEKEKLLQELEESLLACLALERRESVTIVIDETTEEESREALMSLDLSGELRRRCALERCECEWITNDDTHSLTLKILLQSSSSWNYVVREYSVPSGQDNVKVLTREPVGDRRRPLPLEQLASHRLHQAIDNTGNICVWDCEKTLTWALHQESVKQPAVVLELGAGMAGLAALSLVPTCRKIYVTDGHPDSVQNNRVNVRLMHAAGVLPKSCSVYCRLLKWAIDPEEEDEKINHSELADWTLVSDCIHFQEYHVHLLWTSLRYTKVKGSIWMCQPDRGRSLQRFLDLVEAVNALTEPLFAVEERTYAVLEEKHKQFLKTQEECYDPNIHRPRIFALQKIREAVESDRRLMLQHVRERPDR